MRIIGDNVIMYSGKLRYAFSGIVSIFDESRLVYGYDDTFAYLPEYWDEDEEKLTPAECVEIADFMIGKWQQFRSKYESGKYD